MIRLAQRNKYGNRKVWLDGVRFDSQKECNRYVELKLMHRAKAITDLLLQPAFVLQEKFTDRTGKKHQALTYRADFSYMDLVGNTHVEDVKASAFFTTDIYKVKKKLFLKKYPNIFFHEIY